MLLRLRQTSRADSQNSVVSLKKILFFSYGLSERSTSYAPVYSSKSGLLPTHFKPKSPVKMDTVHLCINADTSSYGSCDIYFATAMARYLQIGKRINPAKSFIEMATIDEKRP